MYLVVVFELDKTTVAHFWPGQCLVFELEKQLFTRIYKILRIILLEIVHISFITLMFNAVLQAYIDRIYLTWYNLCQLTLSPPHLRIRVYSYSIEVPR